MAEFKMRNNAFEVSRTLDNLGKDAPARTAPVVRSFAHKLRTNIRANARGRPGPRRITGDYARSWQVEVQRTPWGALYLVWTAAPQAWRLEKGFWAKYDSLGRFYRQPPYAHVFPAVIAIRPAFNAAIFEAALPRELRTKK